MQLVETARRLEAHTSSVVTKAPKRCDPHLLYEPMALATTVHDEVWVVNNTCPRSQHEVQVRRNCPAGANIIPQNLSPKLILFHSVILQNPEKCPWTGHAMQEFGEYIREEARLIAKTKKADSRRCEDLPVQVLRYRSSPVIRPLFCKQLVGAFA